MIACFFEKTPSRTFLKEVRRLGGVIMTDLQRKKVPEVSDREIKMSCRVKKALGKKMEALHRLLENREARLLARIGFDSEKPIASLLLLNSQDLICGRSVGKVSTARIRLAMRKLGLDMCDFIERPVYDLARKISSEAEQAAK